MEPIRDPFLFTALVLLMLPGSLVVRLLYRERGQFEAARLGRRT